MPNVEPHSACPKCTSSAYLVEKLLLIAAHGPGEINEGGHWPYQLAADECEPAVLREGVLRQFVDGLYCTKCGVGFVPAAYRLSSAPGSSPVV